MWVVLWILVLFWIAIALTVKIWYNKNEMDIPYKFFNVCWVICLVYTFIKGWLFFISLACFGIAYGIRRKYEDKDEDFIYWPLKHKW